LYRDINNILIIKGNCVNIINKDNIFINNIYKDIIYLILFVNIIRSLKVKGKGLQITRDIIKQQAQVKERLL
jgi:hypothetical protein